jgi:hypothetical protein
MISGEHPEFHSDGPIFLQPIPNRHDALGAFLGLVRFQGHQSV